MLVFSSCLLRLSRYKANERNGKKGNEQPTCIQLLLTMMAKIFFQWYYYVFVSINNFNSGPTSACSCLHLMVLKVLSTHYTELNGKKLDTVSRSYVYIYISIITHTTQTCSWQPNRVARFGKWNDREKSKESTPTNDTKSTEAEKTSQTNDVPSTDPKWKHMSCVVYGT